MATAAVRGFKDILPGEVSYWRKIEETARDTFRVSGFQEIRIPILEKTEIFARGIGEHTDIVEKEMYTFTDRSGDSLTLRPEATAGLLRAVIEHKLYGRQPLLKLFTMGPMFRHERPQKGRLRQFHQINAEAIGTVAPAADAEVIWMAWRILERLASGAMRIELNSIGCPLCRPFHREDLILYLSRISAKLCTECRRRSKTNPLRVFDCKNDPCRELMQRAPLLQHYYCPECGDHFAEVIRILKRLDIPFVINPYLVRGLDYYVRTTFEITSPDLGAQSTVAAGGRYDGLVKDLGGPDLAGVGMAIGVERLILLMDRAEADHAIDLFICALGPTARKKAVPWIKNWRNNGVSAQMSYEDKSLKAQMKQADRTGARQVVIVGDNELEKGIVTVRDMVAHEQRDVSVDEVVELVEDIVRSPY
ncbi:MAG TPA: histidine--tRNA ligase [Thermodesulfobacteriaceae bacterium]|nr:histidine--tRNA ligase [Thermodesulfobacteriaceae bacterium]